MAADVPVDVVAIAFSVGDSFGGSGADELAHAIRESLQELNPDRIVALIGLAVYEPTWTCSTAVTSATTCA